MPISRDFDASHDYSGSGDAIGGPITLGFGARSVELITELDTGAAHCVFERKYAAMLELDGNLRGFSALGQWQVRFLLTNTRSPSKRWL